MIVLVLCLGEQKTHDAGRNRARLVLSLFWELCRVMGNERLGGDAVCVHRQGPKDWKGAASEPRRALPFPPQLADSDSMESPNPVDSG